MSITDPGDVSEHNAAPKRVNSLKQSDGSYQDQGGSGDSAHVKPDQLSPDYEHVAASQTGQILGSTGAAGDFVHTLTFSTTSATAAKVILYDNGTEIYSNASTIGIGTWSLPLNVYSKDGAFTVDTQANVTALITGNFT